MPYALFDHMTSEEMYGRWENGDYLCDNDSVKIHYYQDITDIVDYIAKLDDDIDYRSRPRILCNMVANYLIKYNMEYRHGIHWWLDFKSSPSSFTEEFILTYGFCDPEEDVIHALKSPGISEQMIEFMVWYESI